MIARVLPLAIALLASASTLARAADEEERTQAPPAPPPASVDARATGTTTEGDAARVRELLDEVDPASWAFRWFAPSEGVESTGELRSTQTGFLRARRDFGAPGRLVFKARRDRAIYGERSLLESPEAQDPFQRWHDRASLSWDRRGEGIFGLVRATAGYDAESGSRPELAAGRDAANVFDTTTFGAPSRLSFDRRSVMGAADLRGESSGVRFRADLQLRQDLVERDFSAADLVAGQAPGALSIRTRDVQRSAALSLGADAALGPAFLVGGGLRTEWRRGDPRTSRSYGNPLAPATVWRSVDIDTESWRHRATLGAAWFPTARSRAALRVDAESATLRGRSTEDRDGATFLVATGRTDWRPWSSGAQLDAAMPIATGLELQALARGKLAGGEDDVTRQLLLSDGVTPVSAFVQDATRSRESGAVELQAVARPLVRSRIFAGARLERAVRGVRSSQASPIAPPPRRSSDRSTAFAGTRLRVLRASVDAKLSLFREDLDNAGARPARSGIDARLRAARTFGPTSLWALAAWTDDRLDTEPRASVTFAPIEFRERTMVFGGGATVAARGGFLSASAIEAVSTGASATRLDDLSLGAGAPLTKKIALSAQARWLQFHDAHAGGHDGAGVGGMVRVAATF